MGEDARAVLLQMELQRGRRGWERVVERRRAAMLRRWAELAAVALRDLGDLAPFADLADVPADWLWVCPPANGAAHVLSIDLAGLAPVRARFEYRRTGIETGEWARVPWDVLGLDSRRWPDGTPAETEWAVVAYRYDGAEVVEAPRLDWCYAPDVPAALAAAEAWGRERAAMERALDSATDRAFGIFSAGAD